MRTSSLRIGVMAVAAVLATLPSKGAAAPREDASGLGDPSVHRRGSPVAHIPSAGERGSRFGFAAGLGTSFPLDLGVTTEARFPARLFVRFDLGYVPNRYIDAINSACVGLGCYDRDTADLVDALIARAFTLRPSIGVRPFRRNGFALWAGYTALLVGGGTGDGTAIERVTGRTLPNEVANVPMSARGHAFHVGVGYSIPLPRRLELRFSFEYFQMLASSTSIDLHGSTPESEAAIRSVEAQLDDHLSRVLTRYVKMPVIGIHLLYGTR